MKPDILGRSDIKMLVDAFYGRVRNDSTLAYLFDDVARVVWDRHLPRMYDFWENVIFQTGTFRGNPMVAHARLHQLSPLTTEHFDRWLGLFIATVDDYFEGVNADVAKKRASSISQVMQYKIL